MAGLFGRDVTGEFWGCIPALCGAADTVCAVGVVSGRSRLRRGGRELTGLRRWCRGVAAVILWRVLTGSARVGF